MPPISTQTSPRSEKSAQGLPAAPRTEAAHCRRTEQPDMRGIIMQSAATSDVALGYM